MAGTIPLAVLMLGVFIGSAQCKMDNFLSLPDVHVNGEYQAKELLDAVSRHVKLFHDVGDMLGKETVSDRGYEAIDIFEATRVLLDFLNSPLGQSIGSQTMVQGEKILGFVTKYSYALGSVTLVFSIAKCAYDYKLYQVQIKHSAEVLRQVDIQLEELQRTVDRIVVLMLHATAHFQRLLDDGTLRDSQDIDELFNSIDMELKWAEMRVENVAELLVNLETSAVAGRSEIMVRDGKLLVRGTVVGLIASAAGGPVGFVAAGIVSSALPLLHSYFVLGYVVEELVAEIRTREVRNTMLRMELEIFRMRFDELQKRNDLRMKREL